MLNRILSCLHCSRLTLVVNVSSFIAWSFLIMLSGCSERHVNDKSASSSTSTIKSIVLTPERLDFGKVSPSDKPIELSFAVENLGDKPVHIVDISSGCGCTIIDIPKEPIQPGMSVSLAASVNINGRRGSFSNQVAIKTEPTQILLLDIVGEISPPFWFDGQAVRCTADTTSIIAKSTFNIYTSDYADAEFDFTDISKDISIKEISRSTSGDETTIKFALEVALDGTENKTHLIRIKPIDIEASPLDIPLYVYRKEKGQTPPTLSTTQISLETILSDSAKEFSVTGDPDIIQTIDSVSLLGFSDVFSIEKTEIQSSEKGSLGLRLIVKGADFSGPVEGKLKLKTFGGREYSIPISGKVESKASPNDAETDSKP